MTSIRARLLTAGVAIGLVIFGSVPLEADRLCGDVNSDDRGPNVADITFLVGYLFRSTPPIPNFRPAELDGHWGVNVADLTYLINYVFKGGPSPACMLNGTIDDGIGCLSDSMPARSIPSAATQSSGCVESTGPEIMWAELQGNDLHVFHYNVEYQCCLMYEVAYSVNGYEITAVEHDTAETACPCLCTFNLESVLPDFAWSQQGEYVVTLIGIYGDTVGTDTVTLVPGIGSIALEVIGNDLHVHHVGAIANCCPGFFFDYYVEPGRITVVEWDSLYLCDCVCRFDLESVVPSLDPGTYEVTVTGVCTYPSTGGCPTVGIDTVTIGPVSELK